MIKQLPEFCVHLSHDFVGSDQDHSFHFPWRDKDEAAFWELGCELDSLEYTTSHRIPALNGHPI